MNNKYNNYKVEKMKKQNSNEVLSNRNRSKKVEKVN